MDEHRLVDPSSFKAKSFSAPFSSFNWVDKHYPGNYAIRRLFSLGRSRSAQTLLIEDIQPSGMIREENKEIKGYVVDHSMEDLVRLSFWGTKFKKPNASDCRDENCIGYAILKHDKAPSRNYDEWHVFEAIFRQYPDPHNCAANPMRVRLNIGGFPIAMEGELYAQQNQLNKACAQVALRSLISKILRRDITYTKINRFAQQAIAGKFDPASGLNTKQIRAVLDGFGVRFIDFDYTQHPYYERHKNPYHKYVYAGIESGNGALLGFKLRGPSIKSDSCHIIPFYGHTFNQDTWAPDADILYFRVGEKLRYVSSINWTSSFLGHDDNIGPNFCIPRLYISPKQVLYVAELLKPGFIYGGAQAEAMSLRFLYTAIKRTQSQNIWWQRLAFYTDPQVQRVVLRAISVNRDTYIQHLRIESDWDGNCERPELITFLANWLPKYLWIIEVSIPQLFPANERKLGEIVLNGEMISDDEGNRSRFCMARLPSLFYFNLGKKKFLIVPSDLRSHLSVIRL
jgi:hypothetical protein